MATLLYDPIQDPRFKKSFIVCHMVTENCPGNDYKEVGGGGDPPVFKVRLCFESNADLLSEEMGDLSASMVICIAGVCFPKFESRACAKSVVPTGEDEGRGCDS